jgi:hypothetical protein
MNSSLYGVSAGMILDRFSNTGGEHSSAAGAIITRFSRHDSSLGGQQKEWANSREIATLPPPAEEEVQILQAREKKGQTAKGDSVWVMSRCTHHRFRRCEIHCSHTAASVMVCVSPASFLRFNDTQLGPDAECRAPF